MRPCLEPDETLAERYFAARAATRRLWSLVAPEALAARPVPLRRALRFYAGHLAAFNVNVLRAAGLLREAVDEGLCASFARGVDPAVEGEAGPEPPWPGDEAAAAFIECCDRLVVERMLEARRADVLLTCIEHEEMHYETLAYLIFHLPPALKRAPPGYAPITEAAPVRPRWVAVPPGDAILGAPPTQAFGWDNEYPRCAVAVEAFLLRSHKTTNAEFLAFVEAGGYGEPRLWSAEGRREILARGIGHPPAWRREGGAWLQQTFFGELALQPEWPVIVSAHEAEAFCRWEGSRLPTEAEFQHAAYPGGAVGAADESAFTAAPPIDLHPVGAPFVNPGRLGLCETTGNGWEWTASDFAGFAGFHPRPYYPGYSADFFGGAHAVVKGASPLTAHGLVRASFRNWYRRGYRWAYTTFRRAKSAHA